MDSEHRHELAENDLARILQGAREKAGGSFGPVIAGVVAIAVVLIGFSIVRGQSKAATQKAWQELSSAQVADKFGEVAKDYEGTEVAAWARVNEGRLFLQEGIRESFNDKEAAATALDLARKAFEAVLADRSAPAETRERALFGLAEYQESISDGDTSKAVAAYQKVIDEFPQGSYTEYAKSRVEVLESEAGKEFYAWFSKQEPKREAPGSPLDLGAGDPPIPPPPSIGTENEETSAEAPATGDGEMKETPAGEGDSKEAAPGDGEKPAAETKPAADEKPTEEKPAAETKPESPAPEEPAAESKPAEPAAE